MKVTTDACLFGAWVAHQLKTINLSGGDALDIGTGTGLLSLMIAQETNFKIDAIEINADAFSQAIDNLKKSPWSNRVQTYNQSLQTFEPIKKYQIIFSNPPFYENDLKSPTLERNIAMHDDTLKMEEIFSFAKNHLLETGHLFLLIPHKRYDELMKISEQFGLQINDVIHVKQTEKHTYFRSFLHLSKHASKDINHEELVIKIEGGAYSCEFINYLNLFYLNF